MFKKYFVVKKLEFIETRLEQLEKYKNFSLEQFEKDLKERKFVEKLIQETVDCAVDINQHFLEKLVSEKGWNGARSFRIMNSKILMKHKIQFSDEELNLLSDSVNFRNEIIHSYDVNVYIVWSKRNLAVFLNLYKDYIKKILELMKKIKDIVL